MSCYHPMLRYPLCNSSFDSFRYRVDDNGEIKFKLMSAENFRGDLEAYLSFEPLASLVPCGKCIGCRLDYSRQWADRMLLELEATPGQKAIFVTLTYSPGHEHIFWCHNENGILGENYSLDKRDCQLFLKRLRARFSDRSIRFYCAGEYGETTLRPHYHLIIFGLDLDDVEAVPFLKPSGDQCRNELGDLYYVSPVLEELWSDHSVPSFLNDFTSERSLIGFVSVGQVTWRSCAYVARYVAKKWSTGIPDWLFDAGLVKPFTLMSLKPGIGAPFIDQWFSTHDTDFSPLEFNSFSCKEGKKVKLPRYLKERAGKDNPDLLRFIKERAAELGAESRALKLSKTDLSYFELLQVEENKKLSDTKILKKYRKL